LIQPQIPLHSKIREHGYAILPGIFSEREITELADQLSLSELKRSRAGARHILSVPAVRQIAEDERLRSIARSALGETAIPFRVTLFDKSPTSNWLVAWHQDTALPFVEKVEKPGWGPWSNKEGVIYSHAPKEALEQIVALRLHLDDSTLENGPLKIIPGTHCIGVLTDSEVRELSARSPAVDGTVARGGVIAMRPLVIHASSKSGSDLPRRVLHIEYASRLQIDVGLRLAEV